MGLELGLELGSGLAVGLGLGRVRVTWTAEIGMMPCREIKPTVGLRPTTPLLFAGKTIEPSVSEPIATAQSAAATYG